MNVCHVRLQAGRNVGHDDRDISLRTSSSVRGVNVENAKIATGEHLGDGRI